MQLFNLECFHIVLFKNNPEPSLPSSSSAFISDPVLWHMAPICHSKAPVLLYLPKWKLHCYLKFSDLARQRDTPSIRCNGRCHQILTQRGWQGLGHLAQLSLLPTQLRISLSRRLNTFSISTREHELSRTHARTPVKKALEILYCRLPFRWNRTYLYFLEWFFWLVFLEGNLKT